MAFHHVALAADVRHKRAVSDVLLLRCAVLCIAALQDVTGPLAAAAAAADTARQSAASSAGDSIVRSAVKGLVWRIFSTTATVTVALVLFQDSLEVSDAVKFGGIEFATKYVLYFLHERLWAAIALL